MVAAFVVLTLVFTDVMEAVSADGSTWFIEQLGGFYILGVTVFLLFLIHLMVSRLGQVRIGPTTNGPSTPPCPGARYSSPRTWARS